MYKFKALLACSLSAALLFATSCKNDDDDNTKQEYDRKTMLVNQAENVILPAYTDLKTKTDLLNTAVVQFTDVASLTRLQAARAAFKEAYLAYERVSMLQFGPSEQVLLAQNLNTYPTNTDSINNRIQRSTQSGISTLATATPAAKGLPALGYLLFSNADDNTVLNTFVTDTYAINRRLYIRELAKNINDLSKQVYDQWNPAAGNYVKTFEEATGTSVGSATSDLVNQLNSDIDMVKRYKVGIPAGIIGGQIRATNLEGYYSGYSKELLKENMLAQKNLFTGTDKQGNNGQGLDDYLNFLEAKRNGQPLAASIIAKYDEILAQIDALPNPLSQSVTSHNQQFIDLYNNMNQLIILTKTDMPSAMGISITYQDNDGD